MAEYIGRTGSCTEGRFYPDSNLSAYAREHGFQTALIGAKFKGTNKLYTYWGHTGMKRGDYAKVLVPRGACQKETVVRVAAVVPALELKQANGRTAKHIQSVLVGHIPPSLKIPLPSDPFTQSWRNAAAFDVVPAPATEHAKTCVAEIDGVLSDEAIDFKTASDVELRARGEAMHYAMEKQIDKDTFKALYDGDAVTVQMPEDVAAGSFLTLDFADLGGGNIGLCISHREGDVLHTDQMHTAKYESNMQRVQKQVEQYRKAYPAMAAFCGTLANLSPEFIEKLCGFRYNTPRSGRVTSRSLPDNIPRFNPNRLLCKKCTHAIVDELHNPETIKETTMSTKIENVIYVTLPGSTTRLVASQVSAAAYFDAIASLEAQIAKLEKINTKPRSLEQQIAELEQQVRDLAELADRYHAKKEPVPGQAEQADPKDASGGAE